MKIIRWLLSHTFLILLIVAVIYGYMFWGNLAGEDTPAGKAIAYLSSEFVEVEEFITAVKEKQAQLNQDEAGEQVSSSQQSAATGKQDSHVQDSSVQEGSVLADSVDEATGQSELAQLSQNDSAEEHFSRQPVFPSDTQESKAAAQAARQAAEQVSGKAESGKVEIVADRNNSDGNNTVAGNVTSNPGTGSDGVARDGVGRDIGQQPVSINYSYNDRQVSQSSGVTSGVASSVSGTDVPKTMQQEYAFAGDAPKAAVNAASSTNNSAGTSVAAFSEANDNSQASQSQVSPSSVNQLQVQQSQVDQSQVDQSMGAGKSGAFVPAELEKQLNNVDEQGRAVKEAQPVEAVRESWVAARKSFYQRNYELSEKSYQDVIANTADNFDAYGELGNVYFNQGKKQQAASAYYEAAAILVRKGQVNRARSLMGLLRHLDKSKADELKKLIDLSKS